MQDHIYYIFLISLITGLFGGLINFLQLENNEFGWIKFLKSITIGIGASFVVPLFLQTISSDLINQCKTDHKYYFIYAGFCLIASIFSGRFLQTVADSVIQKAENAEKKADQAIEKVNQNDQKVSVIVDKNSEPSNEKDSITGVKLKFIDENLNDISNENIQKIIKAFKNSKFSYRTIEGISKETDFDKKKLLSILKQMESWGIVVSMISANKSRLWSLTQMGNKVTIK